jgi:hypothetical protein
MTTLPWEGVSEEAAMPGTTEDIALRSFDKDSIEYRTPREHMKQREAATTHEMFPNRFDKTDRWEPCDQEEDWE